ncbi:polysaccharide export protein [Clostridium sp. MCC353]|uniref:YveK family protein n=1 Tax=Clostridium sp. MCC353 TaxID=2592646 RepID=UPI001C00F65F|nr:Wzz/FepE/Etk N-terminal domain-containing protein [Clostridium sp. MCC353]MBT9779490.1 polysaccharide export protein [Clostridium sp. MCC353]
MEKRFDEDQDEIEIDLRELLFEFRRKWWALLTALFLGCGLAGVYSYFVMTPQYTSSASLYVLSKETTLTSLADLQIGSQLTQDYKVMINSRPVLQSVINTMNLNMNYQELRKKIKIDNPTNTRILTISVQDPDPYLAKEIVDSVSAEASAYIGEIMEMVPPKMIEDGVVALEKTSPSVKKNAALGGLALLFIVCAAITLSVVLNDTVKTEEDIGKYLDLPVLAVIPSKESVSDSGEIEGHKKRKASRRKAGKSNGK